MAQPQHCTRSVVTPAVCDTARSDLCSRGGVLHLLRIMSCLRCPLMGRAPSDGFLQVWCHVRFLRSKSHGNAFLGRLPIRKPLGELSCMLSWQVNCAASHLNGKCPSPPIGEFSYSGEVLTRALLLAPCLTLLCRNVLLCGRVLPAFLIRHGATSKQFRATLVAFWKAVLHMSRTSHLR